MGSVSNLVYVLSKVRTLEIVWIWSWPIFKIITRDFSVTICSDRPEVSTQKFQNTNQDCQPPKD